MSLVSVQLVNKRGLKIYYTDFGEEIRELV
jgi:hypothetical protein